MTLSTRIWSGHGDSRPNKAAPIVSQIEDTPSRQYGRRYGEHPQEVREHQTVAPGMCRRHHSASPHGCAGVTGCVARSSARKPHQAIARQSGCMSTSCASAAIRPRAVDSVRALRQRAVPAISDADQAADAGNRRRLDRGVLQARDRPGGDRQYGDIENADGCTRWPIADERSASAVVLDEDEKVEPGERPDGHANVARGRPAVLDFETAGQRRAAKSIGHPGQQRIGTDPPLRPEPRLDRAAPEEVQRARHIARRRTRVASRRAAVPRLEGTACRADGRRPGRTAAAGAATR